MFKLLVFSYLLLAAGQGSWAFNHGQDLIDFNAYVVSFRIKDTLLDKPYDS